MPTEKKCLFCTKLIEENAEVIKIGENFIYHAECCEKLFNQLAEKVKEAEKVLVKE